MDSGHYSCDPIQTQPLWQNKSTFPHQDQLSKPTAVVPPGLKCLVEVEEVILKKNVFQTNTGQTLFSVHRESECCGPTMNLRFTDPYKRDLVSLYSASSCECCGGETYLRIDALPAHPIGVVTSTNTSSTLDVSIQMENREPVFMAQMPIYSEWCCDNTIEILCESGCHPVAQIKREKEHRSSQVIFQFPLDMEATLKAVILGAFLYMSFRVDQLSSSSSTDDYTGWAIAGGLYFGSRWGHVDGGGDHWRDGSGHRRGKDWGRESWDCGGRDWDGGGGDCGGEDWGGGSGDCRGYDGDYGGGRGDGGGGRGDCGSVGGDHGGWDWGGGSGDYKAYDGDSGGGSGDCGSGGGDCGSVGGDCGGGDWGGDSGDCGGYDVDCGGGGGDSGDGGGDCGGGCD